MPGRRHRSVRVRCRPSPLKEARGETGGRKLSIAPQGRSIETALKRETGRRAQPYFLQAAASREEWAGGSAGTLGLAPHDGSTSAPELRTVAVPNYRAGHGFPGRLLLIGDDRALMPEQ